MSDESLSKRERQKQRRAAKREAEQVERAKARRRRLMTYSLVILLVLGLVGVAIGRAIADRRAQQQRAEEVAMRLEEIGCSEIESVPNMGAGHFASQEEVAQAPPEVIYASRPATSGRHMGQVALTGAYDKEIDERLVIHNLEHGYNVFWYDDEADPSQVEALLAWGEDRIDDGFPKTIVAKYHDTLPGEGNFAAVAWDFRQTCEQFDEDVFQVFLDEHHDSPTVPEARVPPHTNPEQGGVVDPNAEEGPLLFPPLGGAEAGPEQMEESPADLEADAPAGPTAPGDAEGDEPDITESS